MSVQNTLVVFYWETPVLKQLDITLCFFFFSLRDWMVFWGWWGVFFWFIVFSLMTKQQNFSHHVPLENSRCSFLFFLSSSFSFSVGLLDPSPMSSLSSLWVMVRGPLLWHVHCGGIFLPLCYNGFNGTLWDIQSFGLFFLSFIHCSKKREHIIIPM